MRVCVVVYGLQTVLSLAQSVLPLLVHLQRRFSVYLRIHRLLMQTTQDSDSEDTQADPNLVC